MVMDEPEGGTTPPIQAIESLKFRTTPAGETSVTYTNPGCAEAVFAVNAMDKIPPKTKKAAEKTLLRNGAQQLSRVFIKCDMSNDG